MTVEIGICSKPGGHECGHRFRDFDCRTMVSSIADWYWSLVVEELLA